MEPGEGQMGNVGLGLPMAAGTGLIGMWIGHIVYKREQG